MYQAVASCFAELLSARRYLCIRVGSKADIHSATANVC